MTCIVGLVDQGTVWIGADSLGSSTCGAYPRGEGLSKVFRRGEMLFGCSGEVRVQQILEHALEIPEHPDGLSTMAYLVTRFVPAFRQALADGGWKVEFDQHEPSWSVLLGYRGGLFEIYCSFQVDVDAHPYAAIGCGLNVAQGSLYTTGLPTIRQRWAPRDRIQAALAAAAEHDIHCAGPFVIEAVGGTAAAVLDRQEVHDADQERLQPQIGEQERQDRDAAWQEPETGSRHRPERRQEGQAQGREVARA